MSQINTIVYGGSFGLFFASGATTPMPVAFAQKCDLKINMATRKSSSKDSGLWEEFNSGRFDWSVTSDQLYAYGNTGTTQTFAKIYSLYVKQLPCVMKFAPYTGNSPNWVAGATDVFSGTLVITSLSINASDGNDTSYTLSGQGTGPLTFV